MSKPEGHEHDVRAAVAGAEAGRPGDFSTGAGAGRGGASRAEQTLADVRCAVRGRCRGILRYCVICNYICPGLKVLAPWAGLLFLRLLIGWEFLDSGLEKWGGENWFADIQSDFPFPFNHLPAELNWQLAMWFEIVGGHGGCALAGGMAFAGRALAGLCDHRRGAWQFQAAAAVCGDAVGAALSGRRPAEPGCADRLAVVPATLKGL